MLTNATVYGLTNVLFNGQSIDVIEDSLANKSLNGPGANYIFWDATDPTAKVHMWMANLTQQLISPARISRITPLEGADQLDLANVPVGQYGQVLGCTNLVDWTTNATFVGSNVTQSVFVPTTNFLSPNALHFSPRGGPPDPGDGGGGGPGTNGPVTMQLYQLHFPCSWTWP
jgi:hypothetical protein